MLALALFALAAAAPPPDLIALGVVVSPRKDHSVVLLRAGGHVRVAAVGETAFGGRVTSVSASRVILDFESGPVELSLSSGVPGSANVSLAPPAASARRDSSSLRTSLTAAREPCYSRMRSPADTIRFSMPAALRRNG